VIAEMTLLEPTRDVECKICRWRLDCSTVSWSTRPRVPMPAPARYADAGHPRPPTPIMRTFAALSRV
jgi:hypothetical protein